MAKIRILAFDLNGRTVGRIVGQKTLDSNATLEEAIRNGYVVGQLSSVKGNVDGVMRCMIDGIQRDGNGRKIDGYLSLNAFAKGLIKELTDSYESRKVVVRRDAAAVVRKGPDGGYEESPRRRAALVASAGNNALREIRLSVRGLEAAVGQRLVVDAGVDRVDRTLQDDGCVCD